MSGPGRTRRSTQRVPLAARSVDIARVQSLACRLHHSPTSEANARERMKDELKAGFVRAVAICYDTDEQEDRLTTTRPYTLSRDAVFRIFNAVEQVMATLNEVNLTYQPGARERLQAQLDAARDGGFQAVLTALTEGASVGVTPARRS